MKLLFMIIGVVGVLLITVGIIIRGRREQDYFYTLGGMCLLGYSIYIREWIFVVLQTVFTATALYDFHKNRFRK